MRMNRFLRFSALAVALLLGTTLGVETIAQNAGPPANKLGTVERDVRYCTAGAVDLNMDVYYPNAANGALPVAIYVHGGGWSSGDKAKGAGSRDIPELKSRGYLVVAVNYRLAPQFKFPTMIEDVKCAVRSLRANAALYGLDPQRIGAWGGSAGGHLVSLLGVTDKSADLEGSGQFLEQSSRVQAVVDMFGPIDLTLAFGDTPSVFNKAFGATSADDDILKVASPTNWVSSDDPPFLLLHGAMDDLVPPSQSQLFLESLQQAGVTASLVMVENAGHGFVPSGGRINPSRSQISSLVGDFFDTYLKN